MSLNPIFNSDPLAQIASSLSSIRSREIAALVEKCIEVINLPILEATQDVLCGYPTFDPSLLMRCVELNQGNIGVAISYPASFDPSHMTSGDLEKAFSSIKLHLKIPENFIDEVPQACTITLSQDILTTSCRSKSDTINPFDIAQNFLSKILMIPEIQSRKIISIHSGAKNVQAHYAKTSSGALYFRLDESDTSERLGIWLLECVAPDASLKTFELSADETGALFMVTERLKHELTTSSKN